MILCYHLMFINSSTGLCCQLRVIWCEAQRCIHIKLPMHLSSASRFLYVPFYATSSYHCFWNQSLEYESIDIVSSVKTVVKGQFYCNTLWLYYLHYQTQNSCCLAISSSFSQIPYLVLFLVLCSFSSIYCIFQVIVHFFFCFFFYIISKI